jgi:alpha-glucoside transport system substrate-binding protein
VARAPRRWQTVSALAALGLLVAACGAGAQADESLTLLHGITGPDEQAALQAVIDAFTEETGTLVEVEVSPDFDTVIITRVTGGNPPDVALYPQPGVLGRLAERGDVLPLQEVGVDVDALGDGLIEGAVEAATFDDESYGVVSKVNVKSLLWYAAAPLEEAGYELPDDLGGAGRGLRGARRGPRGPAQRRPLVHRDGERWRHRLGRHRLDREPRPPAARPRGLRRLGRR